MKLRWRLVIALAVAGLLPLFPLLWTVNSTVSMGLRTLAPEDVGRGLMEAVSLGRHVIDDNREHLKKRLDLIISLAEEPHAGGSARPTDFRLDSLETLTFMKGSTTLSLTESGWETVGSGETRSGEEFDRVPTDVSVSIADYRGTWTLSQKLDVAFMERAQSIQRISASWALRSLERQRLIQSLPDSYLLTYVIAVVMALSAGLVVVVPATRHIEKLTKVAESIRAGEEETRAVVEGNDEIARLATTFNLMLDRLDASRRKAAEMEKMAAWRELARVLAHEIKNPLTPIQLSVQQLADTYDGDDERFGNLVNTTREIVNEEVESLRRLVREFGDFARAPQLSPQPVDPEFIVNDILSLYGDNVEYSGTASKGEMNLDREKLKRALINLVDNALAASGDKGVVKLGFRELDDAVEIVVEDNGPGVPDDQKQKIFEPYFTTKRTGVGLGLPLVKTTCEQHGGTIELSDSDTLGGARFTIVLPRPGLPDDYEPAESSTLLG